MLKKKKGDQLNPASGFLKRIKKLREGEVTEESVVELNDIIRKYIKSKFRLKLSLTSEELLAHLEARKIRKQIKLDLRHLIIEIYKLEYQHQGPPSIKEFEEVSRLAFRTIQEIAINKVIKEVKRESKPTEKVSKEKDSKNFEKITKLLESLGKDFHNDWKNEKIRKEYEKIRSIYSNLTDSEKIVIYPKIRILFELKNIKSKKN